MRVRPPAEEPGRDRGREEGPDRREGEAVREVAVPAEGDQRIAGGADEDVEVGAFAGEQARQGGRGQGCAGAADGDAGGDAEGGVRDVVHAPNLRDSFREGRRTFVFRAGFANRLEPRGVISVYSSPP